MVAAGGGGIPVVEDENGLHGVDAVIDKDAASAVLAGSVEADALYLLTDVEYVYKNYGTPQQQALRNLSKTEAEKLLDAGEFEEGSMAPKIRAAITFLENNPRGRVVIGGLNDPENGTEITVK